MAKLKETSAQFDELKADLTKALDDIGEKVQEGRIDTALGADASVQSDDLKAVMDNIDAQKSKIDELSAVGDDLLTILDALECRDTPRGRDIESTMQNIQSKYSSLQQTIQAKQKKLDDKVFQSLQQWVTKNKKVFNDMDPVSLGRDTLNEQIQNNRDITGEIETRQAEIRALKSRYSEKPTTPASMKKYKAMVENVNTLEEKAKDRGAALENAVQKLEPFHLSVYQLESWYSYVMHSLKQESMDVAFLFTKIENIYKQREEKREHLDAVRDVGGALVTDEGFGDRNKLETQMADVTTKWAGMEESLIKLITTAAVRKLESYSKSMEKASKDLESGEAPSQDTEEATKQYADQQTVHKSLKQANTEALDYITKCKTMYKTLTEADPADIQAKWTSVQREYSALSLRIEERLGVLQEALPAQLSAEIEMDEVLQEWIEVDTVQGEKKKQSSGEDIKQEAKAKPDSTSKKTPKVKSESTSKKTPAKKAEKIKQESEKKKEEKKDESKEDKVKDSGEEKKQEATKKDSKNEETKKDEKKSDSKSDKEKTDKKSDEKKSERKADEKKTDDKKSKSSSSNSSKSSKSKSSSSSSDKVHVVKLRAGNRSRGTLENGIVIIGVTREIKFNEVMDFVRPHVKKIGLVKFFLQSEFVFVSLDNQREVAKCVEKLDGEQLRSVKVKVKKADVQFLDRPRSRSPTSRRRSSDRSDKEGTATIFDTPQNGKGSAKKSDPKKKGVITLEEIKRGKRLALAKKLMAERADRMKSGSSSDSRRPPSSSVSANKRKTVLTLTELRAQNRNKPIVVRRPMEARDRGHMKDLMGMAIQPRDRYRGPHGDRDNMPGGVDSVELERERQRVRIEQERLERERLQAERERVALERERQKRELDSIMYSGDTDRRGMKRGMGSNYMSDPLPPPPRNDGGYWMQPKRPSMGRDPPAALRQERRQINTTSFNDRTLSHLRFDDIRPIPSPSAPHVPPPGPLSRPNPSLGVTSGRPNVMMGRQGPPLNHHTAAPMNPLPRAQPKPIPQRWNNRQGGPSWM